MGDLHLKQVEARSGNLRCQFTGSRSCLGPCGEPFDDFMAAGIVAQTMAANRRRRQRRPEGGEPPMRRDQAQDEGGAASENSCESEMPATRALDIREVHSGVSFAQFFARPPLRMRAKCGVDTCWPKKKPPGNRWGAFEGREVRWFRPFRAAVAAKWSRV